MKKRDLLIPAVMLVIGASVGFLARERPQGVWDSPTANKVGEGSAASTVISTDSVRVAKATSEIATSTVLMTPLAAAQSAASLPAMDAPVAQVYQALRARAAAVSAYPRQ